MKKGFVQSFNNMYYVVYCYASASQVLYFDYLYDSTIMRTKYDHKYQYLHGCPAFRIDYNGSSEIRNQISKTHAIVIISGLMQ
jgi:hypothetical protein